MTRLWFVLVLGCGGSSPAPAPPTPTPPPTVVISSERAPPPPASCDQDPAVTSRARSSLDCAREALKLERYDVADQLAAHVMEAFPYSQASVEAEELRADVLYARKEYAKAAESYARFMKFHPIHARVPDVQRKQLDADAKANGK